jgi:hypothetical protein
MGIGVCLENNNCFDFRVNLRFLKIKEVDCFSREILGQCRLRWVAFSFLVYL